MSDLDLTKAIAIAVTHIAGNDAQTLATSAITAAAPAIEEAVRAKIKEEDRHWNEAIDWLLNSRHTGDPDIQAAFWMLAGGHCTREEANSDFMKEGPGGESVSVLQAYNALPENRDDHA